MDNVRQSIADLRSKMGYRVACKNCGNFRRDGSADNFGPGDHCSRNPDYLFSVDPITVCDKWQPGHHVKETEDNDPVAQAREAELNEFVEQFILEHGSDAGAIKTKKGELLIEDSGETMTLDAAAKKYDVTKSTIRSWIKKHGSIKAAREYLAEYVKHDHVRMVCDGEETLPSQDMAKKHSVPAGTILRRISEGWNEVEACTQPVGYGHKRWQKKRKAQLAQEST